MVSFLLINCNIIRYCHDCLASINFLKERKERGEDIELKPHPIENVEIKIDDDDGDDKMKNIVDEKEILHEKFDSKDVNETIQNKINNISSNDLLLKQNHKDIIEDNERQNYFSKDEIEKVKLLRGFWRKGICDEEEMLNLNVDKYETVGIKEDFSEILMDQNSFLFFINLICFLLEFEEDNSISHSSNQYPPSLSTTLLTSSISKSPSPPPLFFPFIPHAGFLRLSPPDRIYVLNLLVTLFSSSDVLNFILFFLIIII
jgi:hypothetical protein